MRFFIAILFLFFHCTLYAQVKISLENFSNKNGTAAIVNANSLSVSWPAGNNKTGKLVIDVSSQQPLFKSLELQEGNINHTIASGLDPVFLLTVGKRDLVSQNGWNIFFDKVRNKPYTSNLIELYKQAVTVTSIGARTVISIDSLKAPDFTGTLEITLYNGSPLLNIAAIMSTNIDSTAILYDAGLVSKTTPWEKIGWSNVQGQMQSMKPVTNDSATPLEVKYRSIIGVSSHGSLAVFPPTPPVFLSAG